MKRCVELLPTLNRRHSDYTIRKPNWWLMSYNFLFHYYYLKSSVNESYDPGRYSGLWIVEPRADALHIHEGSNSSANLLFQNAAWYPRVYAVVYVKKEKGHFVRILLIALYVKLQLDSQLVMFCWRVVPSSLAVKWIQNDFFRM